ncbi:MAG TPA: hypothetical protein VIT91_17060, partial [Chthoniobacterales bacterium]
SLPLPSLQVVPGGAISCPGGVALSPPLEIRGFSRRTEAIFSHSSRGLIPPWREIPPVIDNKGPILQGSHPCIGRQLRSLRNRFVMTWNPGVRSFLAYPRLL